MIPKRSAGNTQNSAPAGKNLAREEIPQENFLHHIDLNAVAGDLSPRCGELSAVSGQRGFFTSAI
jgi:hypothetical protein